MNVILKKNINLLIIIVIGIIFNYIILSLYQSFTRFEVSEGTNPIKTGQIKTGTITSKTITGTILNKQPTILSGIKDREAKVTTKEGIKPVLGSVYAGYEGDWSDYDYIRNQIINNLGVDYDTAEFTVYKCYSTAINPKHCIEMTYCVASSESSIFKRCSNNNCMGIKPQGQLAGYPTLIFALDIWIDKYNKYWFNNTPKEMITRSHYCRSRDEYGNIIPGGCEDFSINGESHWTINCKSAINKLNI